MATMMILVKKKKKKKNYKKKQNKIKNNTTNKNIINGAAFPCARETAEKTKHKKSIKFPSSQAAVCMGDAVVCRLIFRKYVSDEVLTVVATNTRGGVAGATLRKKLARHADFQTDPKHAPVWGRYSAHDDAMTSLATAVLTCLLMTTVRQYDVVRETGSTQRIAAQAEEDRATA